MLINLDLMPLQALADKVAKSKMWSRIGWKLEDEDTKNPKIVYEVLTGANGVVVSKEITFSEICKMFEWKWFTVHPSRQMVQIEHTAKTLRATGRA